MKALILFATTVMFFSTAVLSQTTKKLDDNNGFKKYKLGSKYQLAYGMKTKQADGSELVRVSGNKEQIGDIPVTSLDLVYLKDVLSMIVVHFEPQQNAKLLEAVKTSFGSSPKDLSVTSKDGNMQTNRYNWRGSRLNLEYFYRYPKSSGGGGASQSLYLCYSYNDYATRLENSKKGKYSSRDF